MGTMKQARSRKRIRRSQFEVCGNLYSDVRTLDDERKYLLGLASTSLDILVTSTRA